MLRNGDCWSHGTAQSEARAASLSIYELDNSALWDVVGRWHGTYEELFGIPEELAFLEDTLFSYLPRELADGWPERFIGAVPVGADLSKIWDCFALWMLDDLEFGVMRFCDDGTAAGVQGVAALYAQAVNGADPSPAEWARVGREATVLWTSLLPGTTWTTDGVEPTPSVWAVRAAESAVEARKATGGQARIVRSVVFDAWVAWSAGVGAGTDTPRWVVAVADEIVRMLVTAPSAEGS